MGNSHENMHALLDLIRRRAMPENDMTTYRGSWLRQTGEMRLAPERPWLPFEAQEWFEGSGIDFRWQASIRIAPFIMTRVVDCFQEGTGMLTASLFGIVPLIHARGPEIDKGEALRGLAELPWRPFGFRETPFLRWQTVGERKLRADFDDGRTRVSADFDIDTEGNVSRASAIRPRTVGKSVVDTPWSGVFRHYQVFDAVWIPTEAEVTWHLPEGPFTYWRGRTTGFSVLR